MLLLLLLLLHLPRSGSSLARARQGRRALGRRRAGGMLLRGMLSSVLGDVLCGILAGDARDLGRGGRGEEMMGILARGRLLRRVGLRLMGLVWRRVRQRRRRRFVAGREVWWWVPVAASPSQGADAE
ncbi:hypothetical protein B0T25DRAFT_541634 [Lasiosphaeria hispida]|uniref:Secreted protein n=1 Tax=Lasiosphaeria hispida TaxID=260671 RepID=A0AAJ0MDP2_9PEZI|nr:hypothetical protein B0T25DRAFT_541634 [Lasiosphaeria hispida]